METVIYSAFMQHTVLKPFSVEHSNNMNCLKEVFTSGRKRHGTHVSVYECATCL
jgi:hypothetical protein